MKYQPGDIIQYKTGDIIQYKNCFAVITEVSKNSFMASYEAAGDRDEFEVFPHEIQGHWVPGKHRDDSAILDWLCASTGDGDIRKAIKQAMEAEGEREK